MAGRVLAIGDIHGCNVALEILLAELLPDQSDTVVILGDVVDRGPHSRQVIDRLLDLRTQTNLVFIQGNHEEMLLDALTGGPWAQSWLMYGGRETLDSYDGRLDSIPDSHIDFCRGGLNFFETPDTIFVHATLQHDLPLDQQSPFDLRWNKLTRATLPHHSGKRAICGHTAQRFGMPLTFPGWVCLDTAVYDTGILSALDVTSNILYQSLEAGRMRGSIPLEDLD